MADVIKIDEDVEDSPKLWELLSAFYPVKRTGDIEWVHVEMVMKKNENGQYTYSVRDPNE